MALDPYSGLVDLFEKKGVLVQTGNRLKYVDSKGKEHIDFRKAWTGDKLDMLMADWKEKEIAEEKADQAKAKAKTKKTETTEEETEE